MQATDLANESEFRRELFMAVIKQFTGKER